MEGPSGEISSKCLFLEDVMDVTQHAFDVPQEQRPYAWDTWIVDNLPLDLLRAMTRGDDYFLLGPVVLLCDGGIYEIIDGQQRLTTLVIMYATLHRRLRQVHQGLKDNGSEHGSSHTSCRDREALLKKLSAR